MDEDNLTRQEKAYFGAAKSISTLSDHKQKVGCIVVDCHKIISSGHNSQTKCHRLQAELDNKFFGLNSCGPIHAELSALLPLLNRHAELKKATIYIYREHKDHNRALARPCERCMEIIHKCGIKRLKYTTEDGFAFEKLT